MALALYIKEDPALKLKKVQKRDRTFFGLITAVGFLAIIFSAGPFFLWQLKTMPKLTSKVDDAPIPAPQVLSIQSALAANVQVIEDPDGFSYFSTSYQPDQQSTDSAQLARPKEYTITIPKIKVKDAVVKVDSLNFEKNLSHFPGTAIPGDTGNTFITGHSVLPQFADPKNYRAIFTKLPELEVGDDVYVKVNGKTLHFIVQYSKVVDPRDLSVLSPISANGINLTLMTCVPPGTATKRLVVITSLI